MKLIFGLVVQHGGENRHCIPLSCLHFAATAGILNGGRGRIRGGGGAGDEASVGCEQGRGMAEGGGSRIQGCDCLSELSVGPRLSFSQVVIIIDKNLTHSNTVEPLCSTFGDFAVLVSDWVKTTASCHVRCQGNVVADAARLFILTFTLSH